MDEGENSTTSDQYGTMTMFTNSMGQFPMEIIEQENKISTDILNCLNIGINKRLVIFA